MEKELYGFIVVYSIAPVAELQDIVFYTLLRKRVPDFSRGVFQVRHEYGK